MEITNILFFPRHTKVTVKFRNRLYSSQIEGFGQALINMLPSLSDHICHNRSGLPFAEEVRDTELGHVFEHVVLAVPRQRGIHTRGQTTWNWHRDPIGMYRITIHTGKRLLVKESVLIAQAILTNALIGPPIKFYTPELVERKPHAVPLALHIASETEGAERMLFSAHHTIEPTPKPVLEAPPA